MELTGEARAEAFIVTVNADRIDAAAAIQFKDAFRDLISDVTGRIVLNLDSVAFLDSSGLGAVVAALKTADKADGEVSILALLPDTGERYLSSYLFEDIHEGSDEIPLAEAV